MLNNAPLGCAALRFATSELLYFMKETVRLFQPSHFILAIAFTLVLAVAAFADDGGTIKSHEPKHVKIKSLAKDPPPDIHDQKQNDSAPFKVKKTHKAKPQPVDHKTGEINPNLNR